MKKILITTPIYYVNDLPHIGHAYTSVICDVLARYNRLNGNSVKFLTGTDEHGQKVENAALKKNIDPLKFVNQVSQNFFKLTDFLNLTNTDFIRTTQNRHKTSVQFFWQRLVENNQIYLADYEGWYSIKDECFFQEKELVKNGNNFVTRDGSNVEKIKEESYFFRLSNWQNNLLDFYEKNKDFIKPESRRNEVISFVKNGLKDLSISRTSFKWGIKVPNDEKHLVYVWLDALTNYITALNYPSVDQDFKEYWENSTHIIGKDILKFHAVYWPAMLMAVKLNPPREILAHGWWTNEGKKISKSLGNTIDPKILVDKFGADQFRYFMLREVPLGQDGDFSEKSFIKRINSDLSNSLGNLIQRTLKLHFKHFENKVQISLHEIRISQEIVDEGYSLFSTIDKNIENFEYNKALEKIWSYIDKLNQYIDKQEPWNLVKEDKTKASEVLTLLIESFRLIGIILQPFTPESANKILNLLNIDFKEREFSFCRKKYCISKGTIINEPKSLFPRYNDQIS